MHHKFTPRGVCARSIEFDIEEGIVKNIVFVDSCDGNAQAVANLADGMTPEEICKKVTGINCGRKGTSCPDQLAKAVAQTYKNK